MNELNVYLYKTSPSNVGLAELRSVSTLTFADKDFNGPEKSRLTSMSTVATGFLLSLRLYWSLNEFFVISASIVIPFGEAEMILAFA